MMWLTLIAQIQVIDTVVTVSIDSGALVPPVYSVWIKIKNNYNYPVTLQAHPQYIPYGEYIGDTMTSGNLNSIVPGCMTIPANYIIKNQNFDRISVCTHGFIVFLRQTDQAPLNIPYGFDSYNYYLNFLDDSTDQLDTTQILVTANKIIVSGFRLNADTAYKSRAIIDFKGNFINKIAVEVDKADTGLITIIHMFGHKLSKIDQEQKYWDDAILLCQLFNYEQACQYTVYTLTEAIEIDTNITNTIPAGGIDSMLVQINFLKLKQEQPSRTFRSYYAGGFYLYRTDDPNNPVGQFKVIVTNDGGYNVSTSESKKNISKVPFVYKNGKIVLIEKGQYRIYSIDGKIVGVINSNGNFTLKHLKPGVYIIKYNNQSYSTIVR